MTLNEHEIARLEAQCELLGERIKHGLTRSLHLSGFRNGESLEHLTMTPEAMRACELRAECRAAIIFLRASFLSHQGETPAQQSRSRAVKRMVAPCDPLNGHEIPRQWPASPSGESAETVGAAGKFA